MLYRFLMAAALLAIPVLAPGQTVYEARRSPIAFSAGVCYGFFNADYSGYHLMGPSAYADFSPIIWDRMGIEAEGRWLTFNSSQGFREYNYLIGPRYQFSLPSHGGLHPYVKVLFGQGVIDFPNHLAYGRYFAVAPAGGVEIALDRRWRLRAEYEYQIWPDAPGIPGLPSGAMTPSGVSAGFNYRLF